MLTWHTITKQYRCPPAERPALYTSPFRRVPTGAFQRYEVQT
jgi:hypothetical protein